MGNLIQTLNNKESFIIYYDADVFNTNVTLSAHLTLPEISNSTGPVQFSQSESVEWNTIYDEQFGTSGSIDGQMSSAFQVSVPIGASMVPYQNYDFAFVTSAVYASYGTNGNYGTHGVAVAIDAINDTVNLTSDLSFSDSGTLTLNGQALNYYSTVNNVPQYIVQSLQEIAVQIWALPPVFEIIGENLVNLNSTLSYTVPPNYDPMSVYIYQWRLRPINQSDTPTDNARASIISSTTSQSVVVHFKNNGFVTLELVVFGSTGCPRIVRKQISVELALTKMLIIRNRLI